jgi:hypothetical protein
VILTCGSEEGRGPGIGASDSKKGGELNDEGRLHDSHYFIKKERKVLT